MAPQTGISSVAELEWLALVNKRVQKICKEMQWRHRLHRPPITVTGFDVFVWCAYQRQCCLFNLSRPDAFCLYTHTHTHSEWCAREWQQTVAEARADILLAHSFSLCTGWSRCNLFNAAPGESVCLSLCVDRLAYNVSRLRGLDSP